MKTFIEQKAELRGEIERRERENESLFNRIEINEAMIIGLKMTLEQVGKSVFICPEDCQFFRGEDGCGSSHIDTSFTYEKEGDYPICPFYWKALKGVT